MATPAEIDITAAEQLRAVLLAATENRYRTLVVDMTCTRFCDCPQPMPWQQHTSAFSQLAASCG